MDKKNLNYIRIIDPDKEKENQTKEQVHKNEHFKLYKGPDGYMHCNHCRRRAEPGHVCEREYL